MVFFVFFLFSLIEPFKKNHKCQHLVLRIGNCRFEQAPQHIEISLLYELYLWA